MLENNKFRMSMAFREGWERTILANYGGDKFPLAGATCELAIGVCGRRIRDGRYNWPPEVANCVRTAHFAWWGGGPPRAERWYDAREGDVFMDDTVVFEVIAL